MSDQLSGYRYRQPWLRHYSAQNVITHPPAFNHHHHPDDHFTINDQHLLLHRHLPNVNLAEIPPTPNMRIGVWGRGGPKAYFRFHGGIGDGCYGVACRNTEKNTAARPLQLFEALNPIDFHIGDMLKKSLVKNPVEASGGTGVFFPVYPKRIRTTKGKRVCGGCCGGWKPSYGESMKQEDIFAKASVGGDVTEEKECKDINEIPIELLLPPEWTY